MNEDRLETGWSCNHSSRIVDTRRGVIRCGCGHVSESLGEAVERLRKALEEISQGRGRFSKDNYEFCRNTVEDMKALAIKALAPKEENGERQGTL